MQIEIHNEGHTNVISFIGKLAGSPSEEIRNRIVALIEPGAQIELDFSRIEGMTNSGLRRLLLFFRYVHMIGGTLTPRSVPREVLHAVDAVGFLDLFQQAPVGPGVSIPQEHQVRIDVYPTHHHDGYALGVGSPFPLGASPVARGINFAVFSRHGTACSLLLFKFGREEPVAELPFPEEFRVGDVYSMTVFDLDAEDLEYGFRVDGPFDPERGHRFDRTKILLDPMARSIVGRQTWADEEPTRLLGSIVPADFDWQGDRPLGLPIQDLVIYEMHVRGFTQSPSSSVHAPGTFAGIREKIPYLKQLGINCVELMPVFEFDELENDRKHPVTGERLYNYWGYSTIGFYAPKAGFASTGAAGMQADELKALVKELHSNGIEVILDVVFNHTAEGNERGPTISFRGLDNRIYYMLTPDGHYYNFSGCGNTVNCNHPVVREFVLHCLRHWVAEYHIDGFRFDLASILGRAANGAPLPNPPLLEALALDPVLSKTKLIAEAWDAGGLYQVGSFPDYGRWAEWNGRYRDCVRKFLKSDPGQVGEMVQRLLGSPDLYDARAATASINFITSHDGFTLADLVSYNEKHNFANGEDNRDGANDNYSWNCGHEGPTDDEGINQLRRRQIKNALTMLFLSRGVPMLVMGDECGRTQEGNNNAYCHDSPLTWFDWSLPEANSDLFDFCRGLIRFRHENPILRSRDEGNSTKISWHGTRCYSPDWSTGSRVLACTISDTSDNNVAPIYFAMNMFWEPLEFELPALPADSRWRIAINTATASTDSSDGSTSNECDGPVLEVQGRSIVVLVGPSVG